MKNTALVICLLLLFVTVTFAQTKQKTISLKTTAQKNEVALDDSMAKATLFFLQALAEPQRKKAMYAFEEEERFNWYFVPRERNGLPLKEMNTNQRKLAMAMLQAALSSEGYTKAKEIIRLEEVLKALEQRSADDHYRDPEKYYFTVFGQPSNAEPWGWRVEGHHLSLNFSSVTGKLVSQTPAFMGSNPAIVPDGPQKGKQILKQETEAGFALIQTLTAEQLKKTIIAPEAPNDIITGNKRKVLLQQPEGILFTDLTPNQQGLFTRLLQVYLNRYRKDLSNDLQLKLEKSGMSKCYFAWAGPPKPVAGEGYYYRIQHPVLLIELDNTQNNANHVHTVVRDLTNDFGEDALRMHYEKHSHKK